MKNYLLKSLVMASVVLGLTFTAPAADEKAPEKTITGEGKCAKCALKETQSCQNAVQVKEKDKTITYYLVQNDVSKKFHEHLCKGTQKVKVTGTIKEVNGKQELTAKKIELVKEPAAS